MAARCIAIGDPPLARQVREAHPAAARARMLAGDVQHVRFAENLVAAYAGRLGHRQQLVLVGHRRFDAVVEQRRRRVLGLEIVQLQGKRRVAAGQRRQRGGHQLGACGREGTDA